MRRSVLRGLGAAAFVIAIVAQNAWAQLADQIGDQIVHGVPLVGADVGASFPISHFQHSASPGGAIAPYVGYQIGVPIIDGFTFTPIFQPQFAGFGSCCGDDLWSITSVMAGARFGLYDGASQVYFGAEGGYYWNTTGPREHHSGNGFSIQGGYNYEFWRGIALGVYARYDEANTHPGINTLSDTTAFVTTGLEAQYRFLPAPPAPPPPAPPVAQAAPPPAPPTKQKIVLRGVNFDFNKANIRPDAVPILDQAASTLKEYGDVTVAVNGYTDSIGSDAYNQRLSVRRAEAVRAYLERRGVPASRMTVKGFGKSNPVASNDTAEGRAQNRRVELVVNQ